MSDDADDSPGWTAIDLALRSVYGDREPMHFGTVVPYALGGPDPIHGISAYKNDTPRPHWHFVTYGFSELWAKESTDAEVSGFGFELTFRPGRELTEEKPPNWALNFLQNLGRYVFSTSNVFGVAHTLPLNGPIQQGSSTLIHAVSFIHDPQLPPVATPNGRVEFLQIVGLTIDELEAISSWNAEAFLGMRSRVDPLLLTDLSRTSWLEEPEFAAEVARRTEQDGSSCAWLNLVVACDITGRPVRVCVQTIAVDALKRRLLGRLPHGRELTLNGKDATAVFKPGKQSGMKLVEGAVTITLADQDLVALTGSLRPHVGVFPVPGVDELVIEVLKTEIRDRDGKIVEVLE